MREKQGRGGRRNAQGGDGETHIFRDGRTDGRTDTGSYRSGAHLKKLERIRSQLHNYFTDFSNTELPQ